MDLLNQLVDAAGSDTLRQMGAQFGLDESAVNKILAQVVPTMGEGLKRNASSPDGLEDLKGALQGNDHQVYLGNLAAASGEVGVAEGNSILGHILGSKDASRATANQASEASGVSPDVIKQMLPMLATMVMGTLSKETSGGNDMQAASGNSLGSLASLFDADGDGSIVDDALDLAKKYF